MELRRLGATGRPISAIGFGCGTTGGLMNKGDPREQRAIVQRAVDSGITYFDTAPNYGEGLSETNLGRVIRELGIRDRVQLGTKVGLLERDRPDPDGALRAILERLPAARRRYTSRCCSTFSGALRAGRAFDQPAPRAHRRRAPGAGEVRGRYAVDRVHGARRYGRGQATGARRRV